MTSLIILSVSSRQMWAKSINDRPSYDYITLLRVALEWHLYIIHTYNIKLNSKSHSNSGGKK